MANQAQPPGSNPPPKPWERAGTSSSGPAPFRPPSAGNTSEVVEASGTAQPGEVVSAAANRNAAVNTNTLGRPVPSRPWQQQTYGSTYGGGYGSGMNYNSGYGSGMYGSYGGMGGSYGGGLYGNNMYRGGYGGLYGSGTYGGGMYNGGMGGSIGGYGMGGMAGMGGMGMGMGGPGEQDPNNPFGAPPSPPSFWISLMRVVETEEGWMGGLGKTFLRRQTRQMHGVVTFFGRIAILIDQNTQAFHMFMSALLQLFDRSGMLYGELARFVLRLLGVRTKPNKVHPPGVEGLPGPQNAPSRQNYIEGSKAAPAGSWDNVWGDAK